MTEDELYKKVQEAYEAWRKANEVVHRLIVGLLELGREHLTPQEQADALRAMQRMTRNYKRGPSRTFLWPLGGFIEKATL